MQSREISASARLAQTAAVLMICSILSLMLLSKATPLVWEDHFQIGQNLRSTGTLTIDGVPSMYRPPGFPAFVAASLWIGDKTSPRTNSGPQRSAEHDQRVVVFAQGILLGVLAAVLFLWASRCSDVTVAAGIAASAALNPFSLALANLASYHLLFVAMLTFSTLGLMMLRVSSRPSDAVGVGLLWGMTSLVKPVTLIAPVFIALLLLIRFPIHKALQTTLCIVIGMTLVVGPYVVRNDLVAGKAVVTAQGGDNFWASTVEPRGANEPFLVWQPIWWKYGLPIFSRVTGAAEYSEPTHNAYAVQLNDEFWREARKNVVAAPAIYFDNVRRNIVSFNLDTMEFWNKFLVRHNTELVGTFSRIWIISAMILSAAGVIWGCARRDDDAITVMAVYLCIVIAHSIAFATELYTVSKLPLLILGFALLLRRIAAIPRYGTMSARLMACGAAGTGLIASVLAV